MEKEWLKIRAELAQRMSDFLENLDANDNGMDGSICGYVPEDCDLMMADAALAILRASANGQQYMREQEGLSE